MVSTTKITIRNLKELKDFLTWVSKQNGPRKITYYHQDFRIEDKLVSNLHERVNDWLKTTNNPKTDISAPVVLYLRSCPMTRNIINNVRDYYQSNVPPKEAPNIVEILSTLISAVES